MKNYIGAKIIQAELSNYREFKLRTGNKIVKPNDKDIKGYIVIYPPIGEEEKPYISWSPKDIFEKVYREIENAEISLINRFFDNVKGVNTNE